MHQVGAATETELEDRKLRIEDAKNATFAAVEEGIVPGGGAVFLHLSELVGGFKDTLTNGEEQLGADIVFKSLSVRHSVDISCCLQSFILCVMGSVVHDCAARTCTSSRWLVHSRAQDSSLQIDWLYNNVMGCLHQRSSVGACFASTNLLMHSRDL